jgi:hypothetical protein
MAMMANQEGRKPLIGNKMANSEERYPQESTTLSIRDSPIE